MKAELGHSNELLGRSQATSTELAKQESLLAARVAALATAVADYSTTILAADRHFQARLQEKDRLLEALNRELFELRRRTADGYHSQTELRKTMNKFQTSQTMSVQLKHANERLLKHNRQLKEEASEAASSMALLALKYSELRELVEGQAKKEDQVSGKHQTAKVDKAT